MLALGLGILAALCWGSHDYLIRNIAPGRTVLPQLAAVMVTAMLIIQPLIVIGEGGGAWDPGGVALALAAGWAYFGASYALYLAFAAAPARMVAPVIGAYPLPALGLAALAGQEVGTGQWLAVLVIVAGIALVAQASGEDQGRAGKGTMALAVLAALGLGTGLVLGQFAGARLDGFVAPALSRLAAGLAALALLALLRPDLGLVRRHWPTLLAMGALDGLALTAVLVAGGLPQASYAAIASSLFALVNVGLSWALRGEAVGRAQGLGMGLVFGGLAWLSAQ